MKRRRLCCCRWFVINIQKENKKPERRREENGEIIFSAFGNVENLNLVFLVYSYFLSNYCRTRLTENVHSFPP